MNQGGLSRSTIKSAMPPDPSTTQGEGRPWRRAWKASGAAAQHHLEEGVQLRAVPVLLNLGGVINYGVSSLHGLQRPPWMASRMVRAGLVRAGLVRAGLMRVGSGVRRRREVKATLAGGHEASLAPASPAGAWRPLPPLGPSLVAAHSCCSWQQTAEKGGRGSCRRDVRTGQCWAGAVPAKLAHAGNVETSRHPMHPSTRPSTHPITPRLLDQLQLCRVCRALLRRYHPPHLLRLLPHAAPRVGGGWVGGWG